MEKLDIIKEEKVFDQYFQVVEGSINVGSGKKKKTIKRLKLDRPDAVAVLIFNADTQEYVFVLQNRYPIVEKNGNEPIYEIPAGLVDPGEEPIEAAKREVLEEVGYKIQDEKIDLIQQYYPGVGYSSERIFLYFAVVSNEDKVEEGGGLEIEGEFLEVVHLDQDYAMELYESGKIIDGKTIISLLFVETANLRQEIIYQQGTN